MKCKRIMSGLVAAGMLFYASIAAAQIPDTYTNNNFYNATHDKPVSLYQSGAGSFFGFTETGKLYEQTPVQNDLGVRLHKFNIDEAFFYVSDKGTIDAPTDLAALSIYFSRG